MKPLSALEHRILIQKATEPPGSGEHLWRRAKGLYHCKQCQTPLFPSEGKFDSGCGWPAFDQSLPLAVSEVPDPDGLRTEIVCAQCQGHLGHVFKGEGFTSSGIRHCVNSLSLEFTSDPKAPLETAYLGSGCFWGTQFFLNRLPGVVGSRVGFIQCSSPNTTYREICRGVQTGIECIELVFQPQEVTYQEVLHMFFETHDFEQTDGQGVDIGPQYLSVIEPTSPAQEEIARQMLGQLQQLGYHPATQILSKSGFVYAGEEHQDYYLKRGQTPSCHRYRAIF